MSELTEVAVKALQANTTTVSLRPRYEGSNICTWIGFKHDNYLVEEAILEHFRQAGLSSRVLYEELSLGLDFVELDTRILSSLHLDDLVTAEVVSTTTDRDREFAFRVTLSVERAGEVVKAVASKAKVVLREDTSYPPEALPPGLDRFVTDRIGAGDPGASATTEDNIVLSQGHGVTNDDPVLAQLTKDSNSFGWKWRIPYPYCHYTERLQMSGYLRQMEEVVDLFLADRGISIKTLLDDRKWIPACSHSRIRLLDEALMEEDLYIVYTVKEIFKDFLYRSSFDTYVVRDGKLVHTATGDVTHGYAVIDSRTDWHLVNFDDVVLRAFKGERVALK
jgi:acyl-CoA thioesterase FadM